MKSSSDKLQTLYYSKRFTSGILTGLIVHDLVTGSPCTLKAFAIGTRGRDIITDSAYIIVEASYQNYIR